MHLKRKNEDVEQIDELKASTLGSYIKKASHDVATRSAAVARYAERQHTETEKAKNEKAAQTMKKRGMPYTASKITKEEIELDEVLTKSTPVGKWISDFTKSDNPKFAGKSNKERIKMSLGAFYGKQKEKNEETVIEERGWEEKEGGHHKKQGGARVAIKKYGSGWESTYYKDGISQDGGSNHQNINALKAKANIWLNKNKD